MIYILLGIGIFLLISTSCYGLKEKNICSDCKYFIHNKNFDASFGKCLLFPKINHVSKKEERRRLNEFLVTGIQKEPFREEPEYYFCSTARSCEYMCGESGKKYKDKSLNDNNNL